MMKIKQIICSRCLHQMETVDGQELKEVRLKHNLKLREVARELKISPSYLSDIEHVKRNPPAKLINFYKQKEGII